MIKIDKKVLAIIILSIALLVVSYVAFKPAPLPYDQEYTQKQIDELKHAKDSLLKNIAFLQKENVKSQTAIDSLEKLKPKIEIRYVNKYKEIDNASVGVIVNEFNGIFTENGIN